MSSPPSEHKHIHAAALSLAFTSVPAESVHSMPAIAECIFDSDRPDSTLASNLLYTLLRLSAWSRQCEREQDRRVGVVIRPSAAVLPF